MSGERTEDRAKDLRSQIAADLQPVEPLRPGRWLFVSIAAMVTVGGLLLWRIFGFRSDYDLLGEPAGWMISGLEAAAAIGLLALALREALPGRRSRWAVVTLAALAAATIHPAAIWLAFSKSGSLVAAGQGWQIWRLCFTMELCLGLPVMLVAMWIVSRGLPIRLMRVGILCGSGAGLVGDALWRLYCPFSDPVHVVAAHTTGIVAVALCALAAGYFWDRARVARWSGLGSPPPT